MQPNTTAVFSFQMTQAAAYYGGTGTCDFNGTVNYAVRLHMRSCDNTLHVQRRPTLCSGGSMWQPACLRGHAATQLRMGRHQNPGAYTSFLSPIQDRCFGVAFASFRVHLP